MTILAAENQTQTVRKLLDLACPYLYRRQGRYSLRVRPKGSKKTVTLSLKTAHRQAALTTASHLLTTLRAFHLDNQDATWEQLKEHLMRIAEGEGKYSVRDMAAFQSDPRSMHLWRLADRMADEVVIRPHKVSNLDTKAYGVGVKMLMQFKSFLVKSLNERLIRGVNEARMNGRVMDQTYTAALSAMAGGSFYVSTAYLKAQMMPTHSRKQYLTDALDPNMIAYAALTRGSYLGTPFGLANIVAAPLGFDQAAMVRTSILPEAARKKDPKEKAWLYGLSDLDKPGEILTGALKQVPAAGLVGSAAQVGYNLSGLAGTINSPDMAQQYRTGIFNGFRGLIPNDPVSQRATVEMFERWGIDTTK